MFPSYAELHCLTSFTFLRGASHPEELAERAARLGYSALAVTDECSLAGVVRAHVAAKEHGIKLIVGAELVFASLGEAGGGRWEASASLGEAGGERREAPASLGEAGGGRREASPSPQPSPPQCGGEGDFSPSPCKGEGWGGGEACSSLLPPLTSLLPVPPASRLPPPASLRRAQRIVLLAADRTGYGNLSELITRARRRSKKGEYQLTAADLDDGVPGCLALLLPEKEPDIDRTRWLGSRFAGRCWIAAELLLGPDDRARLEQLECHAQEAGLPLVAAGDVHMHVRARRALHDTLTAIRLGTPLGRCGHALFPNGERYLRSRERLARLYPPELLVATLDVAERCSFSLDSLRYEYPEEIVPAGETPASWLRKLTEEGFRWRFGAELCSAQATPTTPPPTEAPLLGQEGSKSAPSPFQGEGWGGGAMHASPDSSHLTPIPTFPLKGGRSPERAAHPPPQAASEKHAPLTSCLSPLASPPQAASEKHAPLTSCLSPLASPLQAAPEKHAPLTSYLSPLASPLQAAPEKHAPLTSCLSPLASPPQAAPGWGSHFTAGRSVDIDKARALVEHELALIAELQYEPYFLTVYDVVKFARSQGILCQGRGSAANSAVCYCLGVTEVDPARMDMLFERFISRERNEPPDIDVDFEHERREEVIQYIYRRYGRDRAALTATVITYRPKSALRDVGKALGLDLAQVDRLAKSLAWWDGRKVRPERLREMGFNPDSPVIRKLVTLVNIIVGFPRHLSQHVGGFVISRGPLSRLVPIENAAMIDRPWRAEQVPSASADGCDPGTGDQRARPSTGASRASAVTSPQAGPLFRASARTVIQWDKDDLDALGLLKVDVLALGMLTAIRRALALMSDWHGKPFGMSDVPPEDPGVYEMIGHADTIGVFQIESRAQQAMLPRMQPSCFYDLVIEVAIVRPGPIQGGMVHPYLRRRQGLEPVTYPSEDIRKVLERTLGVPIFQEQVMQLAVVAAGFTPGEADRLRRAMAAWRRKGGLEPFEKRLKDGMRERGYPEQFAEQIYRQILGFGEYGFPESHSASFALLVYVSCWLKRYEPAAFTCALLNSQPMGFYAPSQLVQDAQRHGVQVLPPDVLVSGWDCTLEHLLSPSPFQGEGWGGGTMPAFADCQHSTPIPTFPLTGGRSVNQPALRLGLRMVKGLSQAAAERLIEARQRMRLSPSPLPSPARGEGDSLPQVEDARASAVASPTSGAPAPRSGTPSPARGEGGSLPQVEDARASAVASPTSEAPAPRSGTPSPARGEGDSLPQVEDARASAVASPTSEAPAPRSGAPSPARGGFAPSPFQGEGWGGGAMPTPSDRSRFTPIPTFPLEGGRSLASLLPARSACSGAATASRLSSLASHLTLEDLAHAAGLNRHDMNALAAAGALASISGHRRQAMWDVTGIEPRPPLLRDAPIRDPDAQLARPTEGQDIVADYASLGLTLGRHPVALLRPRLAKLRMVTAAQLRQLPHGKPACAAGIVIGRQRPDTASGVIFVTLEDETGMVNVVVWRDVAENQRRALLGSQLLAVHGTVERQGEVVHLIAGKLVDYSALLGSLVAHSRDFH